MHTAYTHIRDPRVVTNAIIHFSLLLLSGLLIFMSLIYGVTTLTSIYGNGLVIWVISRSKTLHTVNNSFIANLALSDVTIAVFCIPFQFYANLVQRWDLPSFMCKFCPFAQTFSVNVSIFTMIAIAYDR